MKNHIFPEFCFIKIQPLPKQHYFSQYLKYFLQAKMFSPVQKVFRFSSFHLLKYLPARLQLFLLSLIKKQNSSDVYIQPKSYPIYNDLQQQIIAIKPLYPGQKRYYLGITFDIDNRIDYEKLKPLLADMRKYDLRATINFITHGDYVIERHFLKELKAAGHEIGLHGDTHDPTMAFLPKVLIKSKLKRAIKRLGFTPAGFRTPALSYSRNLIEVLAELGFKYDSSLASGIAMYKSSGLPYIFKYPESSLYEVPMFMQDYNFFAGEQYTQKETLKIFQKQIAELAKINGIALINIHPVMVYNKPVFWRGLLSFVDKERQNAFTGTLASLLKRV